MVRPLALSLFSGAGGIDLGLEAAGFDLLVAVEKDAAARKTLALNRPDWPLADDADVFDFVQNAEPTKYGLKSRELDLLVGGPPCQPFSKAAQWQNTGRKGTKDERAQCLDAMVATAERFLPKLILIENVPGFVRANSGLARFTEQLEAMEERTGVHYNLTSTTLHAEEFGVPQRRQRSFVVGVRDDIKRSFAWPSPVPESEWRRAGDALAKLKIADSLQMKGTWAELLPSIPAGKNYLFHTKSGGGVALFGERTRFWSFLLKTDPRLPSWTLPASPGPATGPFHWESRPFAVEEMARLQTFPASWRFEGSRQLAVKQVGNAAPPLLIEHVGRALTKLLRAQIPTELVHRLEKAARIPSPPEPTPVHERYAHLRGEHARHKGTGKGPQPRKDAVG